MNRIMPCFLLSCFIAVRAFAQIDNAGSGHALRFDGVDDYVDLGNIYDDLQLPMTIAAWVYAEESNQVLLPILVSQDNGPLYNGFWFCLSQTNLLFEYGDGRGEQNNAFRRGRSAPVSNIKNRWMYVSAVVTSASSIQLFVNGRNIGGSYTGASDQPMASNFPGDVAKIGYFSTNSVVHRFKGMIDELRVWNRALTENELRETMCQRLHQNSEDNLIGHWPFDELNGDVLTDWSSEGYNGTLKGNPTRVFSGAPVGDESVSLYSATWSGKSVTKDDLTVSQITGNVFGVHIYQVNQNPSQTGGLDAGIQLPYYGVFLADDGVGNTFDISFIRNNVCQYSERNDNSIPLWQRSQNFTSIPTRIEIVPTFESFDLNISLGNDVTVCGTGTYSLKTDTDPTGKTFLWNTGERTPAITTNSPGSFSVEVKEGCKVDRDTVVVSFIPTPPSFSLGKDEVLCTLDVRTLSADIDNDDFDFTWHDGSTAKTFQVIEFGTYWLQISNACGVSVDSITFTQKYVQSMPRFNVISPDNQDNLNQYFIVDEALRGAQFHVFNRWGKKVFESLSYQNNWDGHGLPAGVYFYTVSGECIHPSKGTVTIMR